MFVARDMATARCTPTWRSTVARLRTDPPTPAGRARNRTVRRRSLDMHEGSQLRKTKVLWLVKGLGPGGAERLLVSMAGAADREHFAYEVGYLLAWKDHLVGELEADGVPCRCLSSGRSWDLRWVWALRRRLRADPVDVVHVHSPLVAAFARLAVRSLGRRRPGLVYTEHNNWTAYGRATRWANRLTYGLDDAQVAVSVDARASIPAARRARVEVVVHGVPLDAVRARRADRVALRAELGIGIGEVVVATVGNYRVHKDYPTLLRAARAVLDAEVGVDVRFVAVGQGPLEAEIRAEHARLGLGDRFVLLGYRPDAIGVLAAADVFTLASTHEGLPVALMEALAVGLPVVATSVGGIVGAVTDGVEGLLVPPSRPETLAQALARVAGDADLRAGMAGAAARAGARFDIRIAGRRLEAIYRSLHPGPPPHGPAA